MKIRKITLALLAVGSLAISVTAYTIQLMAEAELYNLPVKIRLLSDILIKKNTSFSAMRRSCILRGIRQ